MFLPYTWEKVLHVIANIVLVSIPEELFLVMFTLLMLRQFDFLESKKDGENEFKKIDIARIAVIVVFLAILSNIFRFFINIDPNTGYLILMASMAISILIVYQLYWKVIDIFKTIVFTLISCMILLASEIIYLPLILHATEKSITDINQSILLNFIYSLPSRLIQLFIIAYFILKKSTFLKARFFKAILQSKTLMISTLVFIFYNILIFSIASKFIIFDRILSNYSVVVQLLIIISVLLFPLVNIAIYLGVLFYKENHTAEKSFLIKQDLEATIRDMKRFTKNRYYDKMDILIHDLEEDVKRIYKDK